MCFTLSIYIDSLVDYASLYLFNRCIYGGMSSWKHISDTTVCSTGLWRCRGDRRREERDPLHTNTLRETDSDSSIFLFRCFSCFVLWRSLTGEEGGLDRKREREDGPTVRKGMFESLSSLSSLDGPSSSARLVPFSMSDPCPPISIHLSGPFRRRNNATSPPYCRPLFLRFAVKEPWKWLHYTIGMTIQ